MFLIGGPAFSGTTLLALMLNQGKLVCLDEPDFHDPSQCHRAIPFLRTLFPDRPFPPQPAGRLTYSEAVELIVECERALGSHELGIKTNDRVLLGYFEACRSRGFPTIVIFRDIRDALVRPLPDWLTESRLNAHYRALWERRGEFNEWLRYEDLIATPELVLAKVSAVLKQPLAVKRTWTESDVHFPMLKLDRHDLLKEHRLADSRVGIWRTAGKQYSSETIETAHIMGY
jgi:hypothetical protein